MFEWIMEKFFTLTAKIIWSPADGYTPLWTGLTVGRDDVTETRTVTHWWTRACRLHTHLYIWLCIHLNREDPVHQPNNACGFMGYVVCYYTHLAVAFSKERTSDHATRLLHCYQLDNVVTARSGYLNTQEHTQI